MTDEISNSANLPEDVQLRLESIFMPETRKQRDAISANGTRFVHYTSADNALSIIRSKRVWMRNATCMSDYSEVLHGYNIICNVFDDKAFCLALDACAPGAAREAINRFNQWRSNIALNTYITSISEHYIEEDLHGRLSMWRAFGGNTARVALVFRLPKFSAVAGALKLLFSPVAYLTEDEAHAVMLTVIENIRTNYDFLRLVDRDIIVGTVFNMLLVGVTCLKHEGFREEREWRAIYSPKQFPSPLMESSTKVIGGVPQLVYKVPLDSKVSDALDDLDLSRLFDRLIIGPSPYPWAMNEAFTWALTKAGVMEAETRVFNSGIPIRA